MSYQNKYISFSSGSDRKLYQNIKPRTKEEATHIPPGFFIICNNCVTYAANFYFLRTLKVFSCRRYIGDYIGNIAKDGCKDHDSSCNWPLKYASFELFFEDEPFIAPI